MRLHRKIWLWHGSWWAVQLYVAPYLSAGLHIDLLRPYLDVHAGWLIVSIGSRPVITNAVDRYRHSCRGFLFDEPVL